MHRSPSLATCNAVLTQKSDRSVVTAPFGVFVKVENGCVPQVQHNTFDDCLYSAYDSITTLVTKPSMKRFLCEAMVQLRTDVLSHRALSTSRDPSRSKVPLSEADDVEGQNWVCVVDCAFSSYRTP